MNPLIKKAQRALILILIILCSCTSVTEEIYLNEDGSGQYLVYTDALSSARAMMLNMMEKVYPNASEDSLRQVVEAQLWEEFPSEVDSIIDFSSRVPDSIKNDPDKKKYLDGMEMFMKGSRAAGYLNTGMRYSFSSVEDLQSFNDFLSENQSATNNQVQMELPQVDVDYTFNGKTFSRSTRMKENIEMSDSTMMIMGSLFNESKSRLILHLPRKAKKASGDQLVSKEGKDVTYEFELIKVFIGSQSADVNVEF